MPGRNTVKKYKEDAYYHVFNRGVDDRQIFMDDQDYDTFLSLLKRHLTRTKEYSSRGVEYESFAGRVELLAYCLMPSNFHLLFYLNNDDKAISQLMRRVSGAYTTYFNKRHSRAGHLFQGVYKASEIDRDNHLLHATRYIHRTPVDYSNWLYSSLPYYINGKKDDWVVPDKVYVLYGWGEYENYLHDHEDSKRIEQELIDVVLAN
jgi:putative transposase